MTSENDKNKLIDHLRGKLRSIRDSIKFEANSDGGIVAGIDHLLCPEGGLEAAQLTALEWLVREIEKNCPGDWRKELEKACRMGQIPVPWEE